MGEDLAEPVRSQRWLRWLAVHWPRTLVTLLLTVSGTTLVAGGGLLLEMATSRDPGSFAFSVWVSRALITAIGLAATLAFWQARILQDRELGTLYYLRALPGWMIDRHRSVVEARGALYSDQRVLTETTDNEPIDGVLDLTTQTERLACRLEDALATARSDTGSDIVPNTLAPVALAVGYETHLASDVRLIEVKVHKYGDQDFVPWSLRPSTMPEPLPQWEQRRREDVDSVLLQVFISGSKARAGVPGLDVAVELHAGFLYEDGEPHRVVVSDKLAPEKLAADPKSPSYQLGFQAAALAVAGTILTTLETYPDARVYLDLRAPKSVCFAVGHYLSGTSNAGLYGKNPPASRQYLWRRLIPITVNREFPVRPNEQAEHWLAVRVHPSQPSAETLAALVAKDALPT